MYKTLEEPEHTPVIQRYAATHWNPVSRQVALLLSLGQRQAGLVTHHHPLPVSHVCSCLTVIAASVLFYLDSIFTAPTFQNFSPSYLLWFSFVILWFQTAKQSAQRKSSLRSKQSQQERAITRQ